jgi:uncharacterized protein YndB with AHSA1/START domain
VERVYDASPARVFAAFATAEAKAAWSTCHTDWECAEFDFRVGGRERGRGGPPGGPTYAVDATYHDIVPGRRIVYAYDMYVDDTRASVSLVTVDLVADGPRTRLTFTEQGAFLDGNDVGGREIGTGDGLDRLAEVLAREPVAA